MNSTNQISNNEMKNDHDVTVEARRLHPFDIVLQFLLMLKNLIPLFIIFGLNISDLEGRKLSIAILVFSLGFTLLVVIFFICSYLSWRKFVYDMNEDRIVIRQGVFFRDEKTIYYGRIHSVNVEQPILHRLFKLAKLQIETPGGTKGKAEASLRVLRLNDALLLQQQLRQFAEMSQQSQKSMNAPAEDLSYPSSQQEEESHMVKEVTQLEKTEQDSEQYSQMLNTNQLFKASLTSLNFGLAIAFIAGIVSFSDEFLEYVFPSLGHILEDATARYSIVMLITVVAISAIIFTWILSIVLYLIKFYGFKASLWKDQISISYGLLEKKSFVFPQKKIQAVIVVENPLRQWLGYAEVRLQIVTSNAQEQLVIHPFVKIEEIPDFIEKIASNRMLVPVQSLKKAPSSSFRFYFFMPLIISLLVISLCIIWWQWNGIWACLLIPVMAGWSLLRRNTASLSLDGNQLMLQNRFVSRMTYYIRKPQIVVVKVRRTSAQAKRNLATVHVQALGSSKSYKVSSMKMEDVQPVWDWFIY